ncbi:MAG TPA: HAD family hydrolase [Burkholderiaceae bacterium]
MNSTDLHLNSRPIIALDADGVLLDYHHSYRDAWHRAFGERPALRDANAYWPMDRWQVRRVEGADLERFRACFDDGFWSTIPAIDGAVDACKLLVAAGYTLVCVSAIAETYRDARLRNLRSAGFPIESVIATGNVVSGESPKAAAMRTLGAVAFVDDYLPFLFGMPDTVHTALVLREPNGSPNQGPELQRAKSTHANLLEFAEWWTSLVRFREAD